jgi:hypothetical protein
LTAALVLALAAVALPAALQQPRTLEPTPLEDLIAMLDTATGLLRDAPR